VQCDVGSNAKQVESSGPLVSAERYDFYPWSSANLLYKRGPALIFSQDNCNMAHDFKVALNHLEYSPDLLNLSRTEATLKNSKLYSPWHRLLLALLIISVVSLNGLMSNEGSLFVVVIAPIEGLEEKSATGLTVALGGGICVPIGNLTKNFVTSQCPTFAEKPKVFIFIDPEVKSNFMSRNLLV
jgi:hypothetical protein